MDKPFSMLTSRILFLVASVAFAHGASAATLGVVAPQDGPYKILGDQIRQGAKAAAAQAGLDVVEINEDCTDSGGGAIADGLVAAKVSIAIGFLCSETLASSLPALKETGTPVITLSSRSTILLEDAAKNSWPVFRLAPSDTAESDRLAEVILRDWQGSLFALVDDGTIHGRELVDRIRAKLEEAGLQPTRMETLRPAQEQQVALVRRLSRAGIGNVFMATDRNDVSTVARDAASENIALTILGGDTLNAANAPLALTAGTFAVTLPDYASMPAAAAALDILTAAGVTIPEGYTLPAFAAVQIAANGIGLADQQKKPVLDILKDSTFTTAIGDIAFNEAHELKNNPYSLQQWNGQAFVPAARAVR
jgi:branched-chain amino acid transport system substrate-binding protein